MSAADRDWVMAVCQLRGAGSGGAAMSAADRDWVMAVCQLRGALLAREVMADREAAQAVRDEATDRYCRAVDKLVEHLDRLQEARVLGRFTDLLAEAARA